MRVLVWGINYAPEVTGIGPCNTALCEHLQAAGHDVEMVTSFPYYPEWRKRAEDRGTFWRTDEVGGVPVHRCWHYVPARVTRWKRIIHEATFTLTSFLRVLTRPRPDLIVAVSPPLLLGSAAWLASALLGTRYVFHAQDLQPDAAIGLGMLEAGIFTRLLYAFESFAYRHALRVSGISRGMLAAFEAKGVPREKRIYYPNGIALSAPAAAAGAFRERHHFSPHDFLAIYSGNIGFKQGLEGLVESAKCVRDRRVKIIICGDGSQRRAIELRADGLANIRFLPLLPAAEYRDMLADCDLAVITQTAGCGRAFFPSKLLASFAAARPVLSVADAESELSGAVRESGGGITVLPDQPEELGRALDALASDAETRAACAQAGRAWVEQFETSRVHAAFIAELVAAVRGAEAD
jgi:colanic acid biosynthesis glycosyl transferase WcaI